MKGEALSSGWVHPTIKAEVTQVITTGFAFPVTGATERQRNALNLKPLSDQPLTDLSKIAERTGLTKKLGEAQ